MAEPSSITSGQPRNKLLCDRLAANGADRATNVHRPGRRILTQAFRLGEVQ
jgi:hypothetical protein